MSRKPFWLRLELNEVEDIVHTCKALRNRADARLTMCLLQKGLCSSANCDHESVVIHAPYFLNQNRRGYFEDRDKAMLESASYQQSYDPAVLQQQMYQTGLVYRQNLTKNAGSEARPAPAMQFLEVVYDDLVGSLAFNASSKFPQVRRVEPSGYVPQKI